MRKPESAEIMAISERNQSEEPRIICIIRDFTNHDNCSPRSVTLPASYTVLDLLNHVSKDYGYKLDSYKFLYEQNSVTEELGNKELKLSDIVSDSKKNQFQITELEDGVAPIKIQVDNAKPSGSLQFDELAIGETETPSRDVGVVSTYPSIPYNNTGTRPLQPTTSYNNLEVTGFCGLVNQAMTCYLNSLLQTLFMTPEFRNALYSWDYGEDDSANTKRGDTCIPYQLQRLFLQMQTGNHRSVETTPVTRSFGWDSSHSWQQHDVQELCRVMFDALEINWKDTDQSNLINELYQGKLKDYVKCLECKNESFRTDAYLDIPLVIKPFGAPRAFASVEEALAAFVTPEILNGNNQYQCDNCGRKCDAHKGLKFESFPYLLTLQLKRFDFDYDTMARIKLNDRMTFPNILDLNGLIDDTMPPTPGINEQPPGFSFGEMSVDGGTEFGLDGDSYDEFYDHNPQQLVAEKGEYVYELFSIMIHSGSAVGGHYYAYIKSFSDGEWYSFNDQSVTRITKEDIRKTYGGSSTRGLYSTSYTSSANAYMLMYRKVDHQRNAPFMATNEFPEHIQQLQERMERQREDASQARELEKSMCKIKTYCYPPNSVSSKLENKTLEIHKDISVLEATQQALKLYELEGVIPLERCRLVKFDHYTDTIERSFEDDQSTMCEALSGSSKSIYAMKLCDLLLEIKANPDVPWQAYKFGGTTYKVYPVSLDENEVYPCVSVRAEIEDTVHELKRKITQILNLPGPPESLRCATERYGSDPVLLISEDLPLRNANCSKGSKIYVDSSLHAHTDTEVPFEKSKMRQLIETHSNTIRIYITVPTSTEVVKFVQKEQKRKPLPEPKYGNGDSDGFDELANRHNTGTNPKKVAFTRLNPFIGDTEQKTDTCNSPPPYEEAIASCSKCNSDSTPCLCVVNAANSMERNDAHTGNGDSNTKNGDASATNSDVSSTTKTITNAESGDVTHTYPDNDDVINNGEDFSSSAADINDDDDDGIPLGASADNVFMDDSANLNSPMQLDNGPVSPPRFDNGIASAAKAPEEDWDEEMKKENSKPSHRDDEVWDYSTGASENQTAAIESQRNTDQQMECMTSSDNVYFHEECEEAVDNKSKVLRVRVDKRITIKKLKQILQNKLDVPINCFKLYKVYSNNQEFECTSTNDTLNSMMDESKLSAKLGRVLRKGEYKIKIYELELNPTNAGEPFQHLFDLVVSKGMTVAQAKENISEELQTEHERSLSPQRLRLRKKTWKNPGQVHNNSQKLEDDIPMYSNSEMFLQVLQEPERDYTIDEMHIFIQKWKPSVHEFGEMTEIVLPDSADVKVLKAKLAALSELPVERIEIAKSRGTFPGEVSVLDAHTTGIDWNPAATHLTSWPVYMESGSIIFFRDKEEELGTLSAERRKEINLKEANTHYRPSSSVYSRKEKALKIYTNNDAPSSLIGEHSGASNFQPSSDLD